MPVSRVAAHGTWSAAFSDAAALSLAGGDAASPAPGGTLTLAYSTEPRTLHNLLRRSRIERSLCEQYLFPPLLRLDPVTLEAQGLLATGRPWTSPDQRTQRWELRRDVWWHRGTPQGAPVPVTSADVQFSFELLRDPRVDAAAQRAAFAGVQSLEVVDDFTFLVHWKEPAPRAELDFGLRFPLMPAHLAARDPDAVAADPLGAQPVGYGPFRFESWERGQALTLVRSATDFPGISPWIERLCFRFIPDTARFLEAFRAGEVDVVALQDPQEFEAAQRDPDLQERATFHGYTLPQANWICWNHAHPAFQDPRVRRAMTQLYPREELVARWYRGHATLLSGPYLPGAPEADPAVAPLPFDPEAARALLGAAGFADRDGDGVLEREGVQFRFELLASVTGVPALESGNLRFQEELGKAGVRMELRRLEFQTLVQRLREHRFDAALFARTPEPRDDDLLPFFHSGQIDGGNNFAGYRSAACDALLEAQHQAFDATQRRDLGRQLHRLLHTDQPCTFLCSPASLVLVSSRLRNVAVHPLGFDPEDWWVSLP